MEPLNTISAFTQILVQKAQLAEADKDIATFIVEGVRRMSAVLDDLLSSAQIGFSDSLHPVNLEFAASQAMENLKEAVTSSGAFVSTPLYSRIFRTLAQKGLLAN